MQLRLTPLSLRRIKKFLLPVVIVLSVSILSWFILIPQISSLYTTLSLVSELEQKAIVLKNKAGILAQYESSGLNDDFRTMEFALPSGKNVSFIISSLKNLQVKSGVSISALGFSPGLLEEEAGNTKTLKSDTLTPIELDLSFYGSEGGVLTFIDSLNKTTPLFRVKSVSFSSVVGSTITVDMALSTFSLTLPANLGNIDSLLPELTEKQKEAFEEIASYTIYDSSFSPPPEVSELLQDQDSASKNIFDL